MNQLLRDRTTLMLAVLLLATIASFILGTTQSASHIPQVKSIVWIELILIAFVKARWVVLDFMEVKVAPLGLRLLFEGWIVAIVVLLLGYTWMGGGSATH